MTSEYTEFAQSYMHHARMTFGLFNSLLETEGEGEPMIKDKVLSQSKKSPFIRGFFLIHEKQFLFNFFLLLHGIVEDFACIRFAKLRLNISDDSALCLIVHLQGHC